MRYKAGETHPWLDRNGREIWSGLRIFVAKTVRSQSFETFMGIVILSNILIMIFETDADASCYPAYSGDIQNCPGRSSEILWAVVVEKAAEARENDQERKMAQKENERERNWDSSEMLDGFDRDLNFKSLMAHMDIERDDMQTIFKVLDADRSGEVDYVEFCHHLGSCKKRDPLMMSSLTRQRKSRLIDGCHACDLRRRTP
eukprot:Skav207009  [mRNA]  locus=scaffold1554:171142:178241:- [translate_table: standard]